MTQKAVGYFRQLVGMSDDEAKAKQVDLSERKLKRVFASAFDDSETKILERERTIEQMFEAIRRDPAGGTDKFDINRYISVKGEIKVLKDVRASLGEEYTRLFGEDMPSI